MWFTGRSPGVKGSTFRKLLIALPLTSFRHRKVIRTFGFKCIFCFRSGSSTCVSQRTSCTESPFFKSLCIYPDYQRVQSNLLSCLFYVTQIMLFIRLTSCQANIINTRGQTFQYRRIKVTDHMRKANLLYNKIFEFFFFVTVVYLDCVA